MKKLAFVFIAALMALTACGGTHAAPLTFNFTDTSGVNFSVDRAVAVEKVGVNINITRKTLNGDGDTAMITSSYLDSNGAVWAKFVSVANSTGMFLRVNSTNQYIGAQAPERAYCAGSVTMLGYGGAGDAASVPIPDGCVIAQGIKALSNP